MQRGFCNAFHYFGGGFVIFISALQPPGDGGGFRGLLEVLHNKGIIDDASLYGHKGRAGGQRPETLDVLHIKVYSMTRTTTASGTGPKETSGHL
jgi:hypothetical protein